MMPTTSAAPEDRWPPQRRPLIADARGHWLLERRLVAGDRSLPVYSLRRAAEHVEILPWIFVAADHSHVATICPQLARGQR